MVESFLSFAVLSMRIDKTAPYRGTCTACSLPSGSSYAGFGPHAVHDLRIARCAVLQLTASLDRGVAVRVRWLFHVRGLRGGRPLIHCNVEVCLRTAPTLLAVPTLVG